jgi:hypothetical protein
MRAFAYLLVAVLVVIGIGVSLVSAASGPLSAPVPARGTLVVESLLCGGPAPGPCTAVSARVAVLQLSDLTGWTGYAPLRVAVSPPVSRTTPLRVLLRPGTYLVFLLSLCGGHTQAQVISGKTSHLRLTCAIP